MSSALDRKKLFVELQNQMITFGFKPDIGLGQNYCVNEQLVESVVKEARLKKGDVVLEIGPGTGFLTRELLAKTKVIAIEKSDAMFELLRATYSDKNLALVHADFLDIAGQKVDKIVAFPPYYNASDIMHKIFLEYDFSLAVLVWQAEFAEKLVAHPGFPSYCPLSVLSWCLGKPAIVSKVSRTSFFPIPKSDSVIFSFSRDEPFGPIKDKTRFALFLKHLFRFSNKNLANASQLAFPFLEKELKLKAKPFSRAIERSGLSDEKVDLIEAAEFLEIFRSLE